jgi:hypothetical protein
MPRQSWATEEQLDLLESQLSKYRQLQPSKQYHQFWVQLFEEWFQKWPEQPLVFPHREVGAALTQEETEQLGAAMRA